MPIKVVPATPDRWDDVVTILGSSSEAGCWCQAPRGREAGRPDRGPDLRPRLLREQLAEDPPAGMLAYVDGEVAGWLGFGRRDRLPRLQRSRTIPAIDDLPVWAVLCFNVRPGFRRRGVATALLEGGVVAWALSRDPEPPRDPGSVDGGRLEDDVEVPRLGVGCKPGTGRPLDATSLLGPDRREPSTCQICGRSYSGESTSRTRSCPVSWNRSNTSRNATLPPGGAGDSRSWPELDS